MAFVQLVPLAGLQRAAPAVCRAPRNIRTERARPLRVPCLSMKEEEIDSFDEVAARVAEIKEVMEGLTAFKERIIADTTKVAKKVKTPPKKLAEALANHPDIIKIDQSMKQLEEDLRILDG
ncbi:hypothetical protein FVE85_0246 [Porphyridium purpureum]|uniref:Uncharacterized protein n=1 Tax=Porphyridium purpureum TaxID=35688 RepID=A0A5J4Z1G8_PORPP|nr:hypothetical protein FVE85_0246 [Porphyridium purpureum]|eukprot:POR7118..scf208_2